jgi:hypothetical protein
MTNSRMLTVKQSVRFFSHLLFWIPIAIFSLLLIYNTLPYFSFSKNFSFIQERSLLFQSNVYKAVFYIHIAAGTFCIGTSLAQFSSYLLKKRKKIHSWSGRVYVFVVLLLGAPTGLYMSFFAKGSFYERALFLFMAVFWFFTTYKGLSSILGKNVLAHKIWMIRSYAMAMTAVTFRIYHIVFYLLEWDHLENYEFSLWISVLGNLLLAEYFIFRKSKRYLSTFQV